MLTVKKYLRCSFCKSCLCYFDGICGTNSHGFYGDAVRTITMASNGRTWVTTNITDYVMCPVCRSAFNMYAEDGTGAERISGGMLLLRKFLQWILKLAHSEKLSYFEDKKVIRNGIEFYEKVMQIIKKDNKARYSILLEYIWEVERMEKDQQTSYLSGYKDALAEIIEILENNVDQPDAQEVYAPSIYRLSDIPGEPMERMHEEEALEFKKNCDVARAINILLLAEFYRRTGAFDRAVSLLELHASALSGNYEKMATEILTHAKKKDTELCFIEVTE